MVQSSRRAEYSEAAAALIDRAAAYRCFCSKDRLATVRRLRQQDVRGPHVCVCVRFCVCVGGVSSDLLLVNIHPPFFLFSSPNWRTRAGQASAL